MDLKKVLRFIIFAIASSCHRKSERSFEVGEHQSILCVRCSSVYIGFFVTTVFLLVYGFYYAQINILYSLLLALPLALDVFTQRMGWRKSNNYLRILTGLLLGSSPALLLGKSLQNNFGLLETNLVRVPNLLFILYLLFFALPLIAVLKRPSPKSIYLVDSLVVLGYVGIWIAVFVAIVKLLLKYTVHIL